MKYIRKKIIKGIPYYYVETRSVSTKPDKNIFTHSRFLGKVLPAPEDLKREMVGFFSDVGEKNYENLSKEIKDYFPPGGAKKIEHHRAMCNCLNHELFESDLILFTELFNILFMLNSNRAEGSRVTRADIEKVIKRKIKPKTPIDREVINSIEALNFAFSKDFKWNRKSMLLIHKKLLHDIEPDIAGSFKKDDNVAGGRYPTTPWKDVPKDIKRLLAWFRDEKKEGIYPPIIALRFHYKFEAIHPFLNGNGRVGRILLNAFLIEKGFMPVIFFSNNHMAYCNAIQKARNGRELNLAKHFAEHTVKTWKAVEEYKKEGKIKGGSPRLGQWEIHKGNIRIY